MDNYFKENFCCNIDYLIPFIIEGLKKDSVSSFLSFNLNTNIKYVKNFELPPIYYCKETSQFCLNKKLYYTEQQHKKIIENLFIFYFKPLYLC